MGKEARNFSTMQNYAVGDFALYNGLLYRFITAHSAGAWNSSQVELVDTAGAQGVTRIITALNSAIKSADYVDTIIFQASQIQGTRYKYTFTNAPDPRN